MSLITRTWLAFAALGTGLIHLALVIGLPLPFGIVVGILGVVEFVWAIVIVARDDVLAPRAARVVALVPVLLWSAVVVASTMLDGAFFSVSQLATTLPVLPMAVATLFELAAVAILTVALRPAPGTAAPDTSAPADAVPAPTAPDTAATSDAARPEAAHPVRYLLAVVAGAIVVGALTTPALAATESGRYAQPHGSHDGSTIVPRDVSDDAVSIDDLLRPGHDGSHD